MKMEITNVIVSLNNNEDKDSIFKATAKVLLNDELQLTGLRIYEGVKGLFVVYPEDTSYKGEDYRQIFYPVKRELRDYIEMACIERYKYCIGKQNFNELSFDNFKIGTEFKYNNVIYIVISPSDYDYSAIKHVLVNENTKFFIAMKIENDKEEESLLIFIDEPTYYQPNWKKAEIIENV